MSIGLIQTTTGLDAGKSARELSAAITRLAKRGASLVFTPEMCGILDRNPTRLSAAARQEADDPVLAALCTTASAQQVAVHIGSLAIRVPGSPLLANRSFVIGPDGRILARYDKLHLFDVDLPDGSCYRESASFAAGTSTAVVDVAGIRLGLAICYDLRFPALFHALAGAGAEVLAVPAAFTRPTGRAHWHVLLRARAIETGSFVVAAAQTGTHADGRETYGHSLVVDPWGEILLDMGDAPGEAIVTLDRGRIADVRSRIPALAHARPIPAPAA
ncbi:carbon-nitrogen hydrolase family protein [Thermaurantiacus sp.]